MFISLSNTPIRRKLLTSRTRNFLLMGVFDNDMNTCCGTKIITIDNIKINDIFYRSIRFWPVCSILMLPHYCQKSLRWLVTNKTV